MSIPLLDFMEKRGYSFRLHLEEEGWTWFEPTVVDLPRNFMDELHYGGIEGLRKALEQRLYRPPSGLWLFPSPEIEAPLPRRTNLVLARGTESSAAVVAPSGASDLGDLARAWVAAIEQRFGVALPLVDDTTVTFDALASRDLVVFGGSHQNRLALELAQRGRNLFVDAAVPGDDGWVVTTHRGLHASGHAVLQVAAGTEHREEVLALLLENLARHDDGELRRAHVHRIRPGRAMAARFPSWQEFCATLPTRLRQLQGRKQEATPENPEALADLLAVGFDSGGFEKGIVNNAPVDIANDAARYYQLSADPRALQLFRALLFRMADYYLKTPGGACYPADLDFRLGLLVLNFARLEHETLFDNEERLFLVNLLLACTRSIYEYAFKFWSPHRTGNDSRHNHQTFPALSLLYAADYFSRFTLPHPEEWRRYAEEIFSGSLWRRSKQRENSRFYEPLAFEHAAAYSLFTGQGLTRFAPGCFRAMVERQIAATDNFFRSVDYGDTAVSMKPVDSVSARMLALTEDGIVRWYAGEGFARGPVDVPNSFLDVPGIRLPRVATKPAAGDWERVAVDPRFLAETAPGFPAALAFDKLAFRTGWTDDDQYLLLEGIGGEVSHSHRETNGIVRMNHLGRHWLVSNGYGKKTGITNAGQAFNSRELGPADHNMLVLTRGGQPVRDLTMNATLQRGRRGGLLWHTAAQLDYGGVDWFRTVIVLAGRCLLVLDRVHVARAGLEDAHIEWNGLGTANATATGFRLEQRGVFLEVVSPSGWKAEALPGNQSVDWKRALEDGSYPHADHSLVKLVYRPPSLEAGRTDGLATLFAADRGTPAFRLAQPAPGCLEIEGPLEEDALNVADGDLRVTLAPRRCRIEHAPLPEVPDALRAWRRSAATTT